MNLIDEHTVPLRRAMEYSRLSKVAIRERIAEEQAERDTRLSAVGLALSTADRTMCAMTARWLRKRQDADLEAIADQLDLLTGAQS